MSKTYFLFFLMISSISICNAQDILGSVMKVSTLPQSANHKEITISLNIDTASLIYRNHLWVTTGIGDSLLIPLISVTNTTFNYRIEKFVTNYTYASGGAFYLQLSDSSWVNNISNFTHNGNVYFQEELLTANPFLPYPNEAPNINENIPIFTMDSIGVYHSNTACIDPDGDVLLYSKKSISADGYLFPNELFVDSISGDISFKPLQTGLYAISVGIIETQTGVPIQRHTKTFLVNVPIAITGIENYNSEKNNLLFYPNPAGPSIILQTEVYDAIFSIVDMAGNIILQSKLNHTKEINISNITSGLYFIKVQSKEKTQIAKLIKE